MLVADVGRASTEAQGLGEVVADFRRVGIESVGCLEMRNGFEEPAAGGQSVAEVVVNVGGGMAQLQGALIVGDGFRQAAAGGERSAEIAVHLGKVRVDEQR